MTVKVMRKRLSKIRLKRSKDRMKGTKAVVAIELDSGKGLWQLCKVWKPEKL